jgi:hypothetical protein
VNIPRQINNKTVVGIGRGAFAAYTDPEDDTFLTRVILPNNLKAIGMGAFASNQLTKVNIPNGVTTIGVLAFANNQLASIKLPNSLNTLADGAFFK